MCKKSFASKANVVAMLLNTNWNISNLNWCMPKLWLTIELGSIDRVEIRGQNETERTNSGFGDVLVEGGTLEWEKYKRFDWMSNEDIKKIDMKEFEVYESNRMEKNAWALAEELQSLWQCANTWGVHKGVPDRQK